MSILTYFARKIKARLAEEIMLLFFRCNDVLFGVKEREEDRNVQVAKEL